MTIIDYATTQDITLTRDEIVIYDTILHNKLRREVIIQIRAELIETEDNLYIHDYLLEESADDYFLIEDLMKEVLGC